MRAGWPMKTLTMVAFLGTTFISASALADEPAISPPALRPLRATSPLEWRVRSIPLAVAGGTLASAGVATLVAGAVW